LEVTESEVVVEKEREPYIPKEWRVTAALVLLAVLALLMCCSITRCLGGQGIPQPPFSSTRLDCPDPGATRTKVSIPASLSPTEAVLIGQAPAVDADRDAVQFFIYDDPEDPEWNIIAESPAMAIRICWIGTDKQWHIATAANDYLERGTHNHNVMFLIPAGSIGGNTEIAVTTVVAPAPRY
jgi:hypothetical protein